MDNPLMKKDLADSIQELRNEVERRLMRNKYYVAIKKLDDLLEAIRPLEAEVIEDDLGQRTERAALTSQPVLESHAPAPVEPASEEIFAAPPPQQQPEPVETLHRQDVFQAVPSEPEAPAPAQPQAAPVMPEPVAGTPSMPESLGGNVYPATPPQQTAQLAQPAEEVFQPATPQQHGFDQNGNPIDQGQQRQQTDAMFAPRHSAAE